MRLGVTQAYDRLSIQRQQGGHMTTTAKLQSCLLPKKKKKKKAHNFLHTADTEHKSAFISFPNTAHPLTFENLLEKAMKTNKRQHMTIPAAGAISICAYVLYPKTSPKEETRAGRASSAGKTGQSEE